MPPPKIRTQPRLETRNSARLFDSDLLTAAFYHSRPHSRCGMGSGCLPALIFSPAAVLKAGD
jgi:hypothetical protein